MAFTVKNYKKTQVARVKQKNPAQLAQSTAAPTVKAGPKNSIGPKGGSNKDSVPANRTYLKTPASIKPKVPKVTAKSLDPKAGGSRPNQASTRQKSVRINYKNLKSK